MLIAACGGINRRDPDGTGMGLKKFIYSSNLGNIMILNIIINTKLWPKINRENSPFRKTGSSVRCIIFTKIGKRHIKKYSITIKTAISFRKELNI